MAASPELEQYIRKCNDSIEKFDGTDDLATKLYEMTFLEKNLKALLKIDPDNKAAQQVMQMMPEMRRKVEARLIAQQTSEAEPIDLDRMDYSIEIVQAWERGDYDWARQQLQRIAYGMVGRSVTEAQRKEFTSLMTQFAIEDPLYNEVMERLLPLVQANPGMVQSQIYKGESDEIKEQMRYVLYFANELGHIQRVKKGSSYKLYLPGAVIDTSAK